VFYFRSGNDETLYLSSADWMNRNMFGRIELAWPVTDPVIRQRIIDECLVAYLHDTQDAWDLQADGIYRRAALQPRSRQQSAQGALMARYSSEPKTVTAKSLPVPRKKSVAKVTKVVKMTKPVKVVKSVKTVKPVVSK
jgi:polyphosphate kinase